MKHTYYYGLIARILRFIIPEGKTVLYYGCYNEDIVFSLKPSVAHCIYEDDFIPRKNRTEGVTFERQEYGTYMPDKKYDFVILDVAVGKAADIPQLLRNVKLACSASTRLIIHQENLLWRPVLALSALLGLKNHEHTRNWLTVRDIKTYLNALGFDETRTFRKTLWPMKMAFIGPLINHIGSLLPLWDFLKLDQLIVARLLTKKLDDTKTGEPSLTICLTVRDEGPNIEPIVKSIPRVCAEQEILFVEGHSTDDTVDRIKQMMNEFPEKKIRLLHQSGIGQGDAIKYGFHEAKGDIIILYEGDGTSDPEDIPHFYECMKEGRFEFIEGSRFTYPLMTQSMPLANKIGNILFANWFSLFLRQQTTDILSGIKAISRRDYRQVHDSWGFLKITDPFGDFELLYGSARYCLKIGEIPIHYRPRDYGMSKTKVFKHGMHLIRMALKGYYVFRFSKIYKK